MYDPKNSVRKVTSLAHPLPDRMKAIAYIVVTVYTMGYTKKLLVFAVFFGKATP